MRQEESQRDSLGCPPPNQVLRPPSWSAFSSPPFRICLGWFFIQCVGFLIVLVGGIGKVRLLRVPGSTGLGCFSSLKLWYFLTQQQKTDILCIFLRYFIWNWEVAKMAILCLLVFSIEDYVIYIKRTIPCLHLVVSVTFKRELAHLGTES